MVVLHVKGEAEESQFLYECSAGEPIEDVLTAVVSVHNLQSKVRHLSARLRELFFGDSPPETWTDPKISLYRSASEAETYSSKDQVLHKRPLLPHILRDHVQILEKEITASPLMESSEVDLTQLLSDFVPLNGEMAQLWWAGKELLRGKKLCDYIGNNEKTKITVRLQSASSDAAPHLSLLPPPVPLQRRIESDHCSIWADFSHGRFELELELLFLKIVEFGSSNIHELAGNSHSFLHY